MAGRVTPLLFLPHSQDLPFSQLHSQAEGTGHFHFLIILFSVLPFCPGLRDCSVTK